MTAEQSPQPTTASTAKRSEDGGRFSHSMKFFGVEFAPMYLPFERRLQTLAVFSWWVFSDVYRSCVPTLLPCFIAWEGVTDLVLAAPVFL